MGKLIWYFHRFLEVRRVQIPKSSLSLILSQVDKQVDFFPVIIIVRNPSALIILSQPMQDRDVQFRFLIQIVLVDYSCELAGKLLSLVDEEKGLNKRELHSFLVSSFQ